MSTPQLKRARAAVNELDDKELNFYKFVINSLPTAVLTVDADLKITGFNPWAEKVTGYSADEALGSYCGDNQFKDSASQRRLQLPG